MKNTCAKTVTRENAYEVWSTIDGSWTWYVLKKWQADDNILVDSWNVTVSGDDFIRPLDVVRDSSTLLVSSTPELKIGGSVVISDTVLVVDSFKGEKLPSNFCLHDKSVLGYIFPFTVTESNKLEYVSLFSFGDTTIIVPRVFSQSYSTRVTTDRTLVLNSTTVAEVVTLLEATAITGSVAPPTFTLITQCTNNRISPLHISNVSRYQRVDKPYARWFCDVVSPIVGERGEMGDVYVEEIKRHAIRIK